ncbi:MAG: GGDEF domain-containing protein, partial [Gammaproteobacteria bacterium]
MIANVATALVVAGAIILLLGLRIVVNLIHQLPLGTLRSRWRVLAGLIGLFFAGYVGYLTAFRGRPASLVDLIVPVVFFSGACFVWLTARLSLQTALDVMHLHVLEQQSVTDPLTGLFNRRYLDRRLAEEIATAQRYGLQLSVLMIDI